MILEHEARLDIRIPVMEVVDSHLCSSILPEEPSRPWVDSDTNSRTDLFSPSCCAPHPRGAQQNLPVCDHARLQAWHRPRWRGCHGRATPVNGRWLFALHGRVASRDRTVPDSTWHGVSRRGASADIRPPLRRSADLGECLPERGRHQHRSPFASVATPTFSVWL